MENKYTWIDFYMKFANVLLKYKGDRSELVQRLTSVFNNIGMNVPKLSNGEWKDVDPFTVYALFNRGITKQNRITFIKELIQKFDVDAESPLDFEGIPVVQNLNCAFYRYEDNSEAQINDLWEMFEKGIFYADSKTDEARKAFLSCYNKIKDNKGLKFKLSIGLYWIRPYYYMGLDDRNKQLIINHKIFKDVAPFLYKTSGIPTAEEYIQLRDALLESFGKNLEYSNFPELSSDAYHVFDKEKTSNKKESNVTQAENIPLNQILYGPPGTGKTYNTVVECIRILDRDLYNSYQDSTDKLGFYKDQLLPEYNKCKDQGRIEFITFHQSYSYEEFVEGIKPVLSSENDQNTSLNYCLSDGIFKQICDNARMVKVENTGTKIDFSKTRVFKMSLGGQEDTDISQYCLDNNVIALGWGNSVDFTNTKTFDDIIKKYQEDTGENDWAPYAIDRFKNLIRKGDIVLIARGTTKFYAIAKVIGDYEYRNDPSISYHHFRKVEWLYKGDDISVSKIYNKNFSQQSIYGFYYSNREGKEDYNGNLKTNIINDIITGNIKNDDEPYILIIDEINRGNISKIFGELITLIEDDKRSQLTVRLPYSKELFTVPKNLYIIGTMNTSDRSIATIDIALRRRFTFVSKMPDVSLVPNQFSMKESFENLNKKIRILLDEDHQIGHSYFMNVKSITDLKEIWVNRILPLLNEYFYGDWAKLNLLVPGFVHTERIDDRDLEDEIGENTYYRFLPASSLLSLNDDDFIKATLGKKIEDSKT